MPSIVCEPDADHAVTVAARRQPSAAETVRLNAVDRLILMTDQELRRRGLPGFTLQMHIWFRGRLDLAQLQSSVAALVERWPLLTARLVERPDWAWQLTQERTCRVREVSLTSDCEHEFAAAAANLLAEPLDITREAPVRFVVQHFPNGNDVLTFQFSHVLLDGHGAIGLMNELLGSSTPATSAPPAVERGLVPAPETNSGKWRQRLQNFRALRRQRRQRAVPVTFPLAPDKPLAGRILLRWIDAAANRQLKARIARAGMTANISLAVVASGFRAIHRRLQHRLGPRSVFETAIRYNTRANNARHDYFQNQFSRVTLSARPEELDDREALIRLLASQFRNQFHAEARAAFAQGAGLVGLFSRWAPRLRRWLLRRTLTLTAGSFGEIAKEGRAALGATIEGGFLHSVPFLQSPVILDVYQVGQRLVACFTYCSSALSDEEARRLFDDWLEDLVAP